MSFLVVALFGYLLSTVTILIDKFLVERRIPQPVIYTFYLGILGSLTFLLLPFGFHLPDFSTIFLSFVSGLTFIFALLAFYSALKYDEASKVSPIIGSINAIFTIPIGLFFFSQTLDTSELVAVIVLIFGLVVLSSTSWLKNKYEKEHLIFMILSGLLFAISTVLLREVFLGSDFISGLILTRFFMFITVLSFLFYPPLRNHLFDGGIAKNHFMNKTSFLFIGGQIIGAIGGLMVTYSIFLINPAIINSLQGVQYLLILVVVLLLSNKYRHLIDEEFNKKVLLQKLVGAMLITIGLAVLAFS